MGCRRDLIAELLQATDQAFLNGLPLLFIKIVAPQFLIADSTIKDVIDHNQDAMANGDHGFLGA